VDDVYQDLMRMGRRAAALSSMLDDLRRAAPARAEGADRSGAVRAVVTGPDGLPASIRLRARWQQVLAPEALGAAVVAACQAALREWGLAWSRALDRAAWQQRLARLRDQPDQDASGQPGPRGDPGSPARPGGDPLPPPALAGVDSLAEDVIRLLDDARAAPAQALQGGGSNRERTVVIRIAPGGQIACQADPRWVRTQAGPAVERALNAALTAARQNLAAQEAAGRQVRARADRLAQELHAGLGQARPFR
jgi:hypothetical protein